MPKCQWWHTESGLVQDRKQCEKEATYRLGVRCLNGCYGEGEFEFHCDEHKDWYKEFPLIRCNVCKSNSIQFFPTQRLRT